MDLLTEVLLRLNPPASLLRLSRTWSRIFCAARAQVKDDLALSYCISAREAAARLFVPVSDEKIAPLSA